MPNPDIHIPKIDLRKPGITSLANVPYLENCGLKCIQISGTIPLIKYKSESMK